MGRFLRFSTVMRRARSRMIRLAMHYALWGKCTRRRKLLLKAEAGGDIAFEKFVELAKRKPQRPEEQAAAMLKAFQVFDDKHTGQMDRAELQKIVTTLGEKLSAQE